MDLSDIKGVGPKTIEKLAKLNIFTVENLIFTIPSAYTDFSSPVSLKNVFAGDFCLFYATVTKKSPLNLKTKNFSLKVVCDGITLNVFFFNTPFDYSDFVEGEKYLFYGKITSNEKYGKIMSNPDYERAGEEKFLKEIRPVYRLKGLFTQKSFYKLVLSALQTYKPVSLSDGVLSHLAEAAISLHCPKSIEKAYKAQKRIAVEDCVKSILSYRLLKESVKKKENLYPLSIDFKNLEARFGFKLSPSQLNAVDEIISDLKSDKPLERILVGDVASGKTAVAACAIDFAVKNGRQAMFIAPTTVLAMQHCKKLSEYFDYPVALVTSDISKTQKSKTAYEFKEGKIKVLCGTHSLFDPEFNSDNLTFCVIDEQQRFGVSQKDEIRKKNKAIDCLTMTATPIPRTMSLLLSDDMALSTLSKRYDFNIKTYIVNYDKINDMFEYIHAQCQKGRQAYIVCPKVYDVEGLEVFSVEKLADILFEKFSDVGFEIVYGKIADSKKQKAFERFMSGQSKAMFATSVVEVGVDAPEASIIAVLNADRFGIASLHQLRGRVGRQGQASECYLCQSEYPTLNSVSRLNAVKDTSDGFKLAELDFDTRGGGDYLGLKQSGKTLSEKYLIKIDTEIISTSKKTADELMRSFDIKTLFNSLDGEYLTAVEKVSKA